MAVKLNGLYSVGSIVRYQEYYGSKKDLAVVVMEYNKHTDTYYLATSDNHYGFGSVSESAITTMIQHKTPTQKAVNAYLQALEKAAQAWDRVIVERDAIVKKAGYESAYDCDADWVGNIEEGLGYSLGYDAAFDGMMEARKEMVVSAVAI